MGRVDPFRVALVDSEATLRQVERMVRELHGRDVPCETDHLVGALEVQSRALRSLVQALLLALDDGRAATVRMGLTPAGPLPNASRAGQPGGNTAV